MDFNLSREHQLIRKMMAEFTEKEVKPIAAETDRTCEYPRDNIEKLFKLGVMGMCVPKEYGGAGADPLASALCIEELSKQCASTGDIVATHNGLCCDPIMTYGTAEQKAKYLPVLTTGHHVGAFALTEPNAGSDASKGQTEAKLEGDHYVMNGSKIFITNGYVADVFVVFAMTDKSKGTKGISAFIVESGFPGFSVGKHEEKMGLHGVHTTELVFTDCIIPKENLLGREEEAQTGTLTENLVLRLLTNEEDNSSHRDAANRLATQLSVVGIRVEVETVAFSDLSETWQTGEYDLLLVGYQLPDDGNLTSLLRSDGANNWSGYQNATMDAALDSLDTAQTEEAYYNAMQQVYNRIIEDLPVYTLCMRTSTQIAGECLTIPNVIHAGEPYRGIESWTHVEAA